MRNTHNPSVYADKAAFGWEARSSDPSRPDTPCPTYFEYKKLNLDSVYTSTANVV